jgi:hypothetical protein
MYLIHLLDAEFVHSAGLLQCIEFINLILVNNQLDAQFYLVCLFLFSTCFGQPRAHHQETYQTVIYTG